ncbi:ras and EF-hand domain-containing protein isoform X2 [Halichoeres trimaculatus]|uniref:ras and EF-hand domain-containing protein isoform X2 n=1 Tax=Halichoeres trimaculatus TaxID=147232 RepID=UPI003D9E95D1
MERPSLRRLFSACDMNKSGKIEYEDFTVVCQELNVPESQIQTLFEKFDADQDGYITYSKFSSRFQEVSETLNLASLDTVSNIPGRPGDEFLNKIDAEYVISQSLREQLSELHQALHTSTNNTVLQQYEEIVSSLVSQSLDSRLECEQLETSLKRVEEMNNSQLTELEEDIQQQLARTEERVRQEERRKMEGVLATLQRKHQNEVTDLNATVERLLKSQEASNVSQSKEELDQLNKQVRDFTQENEHLKASLLEAQTNISILHSDLDKLKNMYADQKAQHQRETEELRKMIEEYQSYASQIQILQEMNKSLYDSNDGLRSALASEAVAAKRRLSPQNEIPARRMKSLRQSTPNTSSLEQDPSKMTYSHVASWADKYLDTGDSLPMDIVDSAGSDYDSDDNRSLAETVHHSYSYVPSDVEVSEVKSEAAVSMAPSRASSIASSLRRRLSAFSMKPLDADVAESGEPTPMYRLVLAGDAGSGKSSFLLRLLLNEFRGDIQTTLGVDFQMKKMLVDGEMTSLQIWDTAGQERFRSIARSYFRKAHGVLLLYDVSSESSFLSVRGWVDQIEDSTEEKIPMCVIGNKVDLREQHPERKCVSSMHGEKLAKTYGALFCETSAKEGKNVVEAVLHLAREVKKNAGQRRQSYSQLQLSPSSQKKSHTACC